MAGGLFLASSARALEAGLLERLREDRRGVRAEPSRLARPLRIVVPSGALRAHLCARLARDGEAWLGVLVQTLEGLTREVLERVGVLVEDDGLFPIHVRRHARGEPTLREALDDLSDGYGVVRAALDDLLDAGFGAEHAAALDDALDALGVAAASPPRALVRVAERMATQALPHRSRASALAREAIERDAAHALPARGLVIHGFADATGVQTDLLCALVRHADANVWLALPPGPTEPSFGAGFRARLRAACDAVHDLPAQDAPARVELWQARDPFDEARAVAGELRRALDAGALPERIAVVARDLEPYRLALRRHFGGLGVPFSGAREPGPMAAAGRRLSALLVLLREGEDAAAERWLEALAALGATELDLERRADLQHALHRSGCASLRDVVALEPRALRLDVPSGLRADAAGRRSVASREVTHASVAALVGAADALRCAFAAWPERAPLAQHAVWLRALAASALGWRDATPGRAELDAALDAARSSEPVDRGELIEWLARALDGAGRVPLGGDGGGVQVLTVMEARGLDFERIFALGLCRGSFPRPIREDALLPDRLRRRLRELLPELPVKRDGFDEERFLFAQLLASAPALTLSFPSWDAEGKPLAPSPLLDALLRAQPPGSAPEPSCATPRERAGLAGLHAPRDAFAGALRVALASACAGTRSGVGADELARVRLAALAELDPRDGRRSQAGPLLGFAGAAAAGDPRAGRVSVSALEDLARCPWKAFLRRILRLMPPRDARGALPSGLDQRLLGNVVHGALARIVGVRGGEPASLDSLRGASPEPPEWPGADALSALLLDAACDVVADEAIALPSYAHALAERARAFVEQARRVDWALGAPRVLGGELSSALALADADGRPREIHFRADRVDREGEALRLTDYKTGKPPSKPLEALQQGKLLQAGVYALAAGEGGQGRYLFLRPDLEDAARVVATPPHAALAPALLPVLRTLLAGWDAGAFVPRLREPGEDREPFACSQCELKDACSRGDSGVRLRLGAWADAPGPAAAEGAAHALWRLPEATA